MRYLLSALFLCAALGASAQTVTLYDDFSAATLDPGRWQVLIEAGGNPALTATDGGILTVTGKSNRTGAAITARLGAKAAVEVTALGWTGTNQILQLYSGTGGFTNFVEFGMEGTAADGTPILHVWFPNGPGYAGASPIPGPVSASNPSVMRIERDGNNYRFLVNGQQVYAGSNTALGPEAQVVLYGWSSSVSRWDDMKLSGPACRIDSPVPDTVVTGATTVMGDTGGAASWMLESGAGASPTAWSTVASGNAPKSGALATLAPSDALQGAITLRLTATDASGASRSVRHTFTLWPNIYGNNPRPAANGRAFVFPNGETTVAIGENDGYPWPGLYDLWKKGNRAATDNYVATLRSRGVNVMRIMLEAAGQPSELLENPLGTYSPTVLAFWDQFFQICEQRGMTVLLTPWDTFWMNQPWSANPYNAANGGPCATQAQFITSPAARQWQKARFKFMIDRWGNSPAIFAYDLLNEFDIWWEPATPAQRANWVNEMATFVRNYEFGKWGKAHMLTASSAAGSPTGIIADVVYRHPMFEFANSHQYYPNVKDPKDIISPALDVNAGIKYSLSQIQDGRPYTDSESGPIAEWQTDQAFDDLYMRCMAWAHLSSGGAGSGMRWPYRNPHYLSDGMRLALRAMSFVVKDLDWSTFRPKNVDGRLTTGQAGLVMMGSADADQAIVWAIQDVRRQPAQNLSGASLKFAGLTPGYYRVSCWNPANGARTQVQILRAEGGPMSIPLPNFTLDAAVTLRRLPPGDVNADLQLTEADAALALKFAAGLSTASEYQVAAADTDQNGAVDVTDAARLLRAAFGVE